MKAQTIDLAGLAALHDPESRNTFLSLYADLSDRGHEKQLDSRASAIAAALDEDERGAWPADLAAARGALDQARKQGARGAAIFVSSTHGLHEVHALGAPVQTKLVLDSSPYIRPLARFVDEYEPFILVLLDGARGGIYLVSEARAKHVASQSTNLIGRHRNGGMSQMRYQRHRQGMVNKYLDEIVAHADRLAREEGVGRLVLAGPGEAKHHLARRLTPLLQKALAATEDVDFHGEISDPIVQRFVALGKELETADAIEAVRALRRALRTGDLAAVGAFETVRAARDARVDLLVVQQGAVAGGRKCEEHQEVFPPDGRCPCGNEGTEVDLLNEAVEYASRMEARIEFVPADDPFLEGIGGVGAVLRW